MRNRFFLFLAFLQLAAHRSIIKNRATFWTGKAVVVIKGPKRGLAHDFAVDQTLELVVSSERSEWQGRYLKRFDYALRELCGPHLIKRRVLWDTLLHKAIHAAWRFPNIERGQAAELLRPDQQRLSRDSRLLSSICPTRRSSRVRR